MSVRITDVREATRPISSNIGERTDLVLEAAPAHRALLAEEQEARQRVRALALIQFLADAAPVRGIVEKASTK